MESGEIKPNKTTYYLERKDPDFESKMHEALVVYKQVSLCYEFLTHLINLSTTAETVSSFV